MQLTHNFRVQTQHPKSIEDGWKRFHRPVAKEFAENLLILRTETEIFSLCTDEDCGGLDQLSHGVARGIEKEIGKNENSGKKKIEK